jgi:hypothetical protein
MHVLDHRQVHPRGHEPDPHEDQENRVPANLCGSEALPHNPPLTESAA